uniref:histidine--tRNA ligase n=1 Tax=Antithamnionella ternifolia TaxID=207919 RepID=A0A4D6WJB9_9FLOR|nr:Histidine-tRNA ligase [Antithamnionella ternifolia]
MQPLRGTKDILPDEVVLWQHIYNKVHDILLISNYHEIRTPIIEATDLFKRSIGDGTDIINKEMYSFTDQGNREITLRPEGTACISRSFISNKLYAQKGIHRLWYFGPMFRYERPQNGRQRQFHQLGLECIGSYSPIADTEVIRLANKILQIFKLPDYNIEINSIGNLNERNQYKQALVEYLTKYIDDLDKDSQQRIHTNPLRILDSKNLKTQEILDNAPKILSYLNIESLKHFNTVCELLNSLNIQYKINNKLVRGLDYYNYTAFEIKTNLLGSQDTICGGGRYDSLIKQLGGPNTPSVGWAIGLERLIFTTNKIIQNRLKYPKIYLVNQNIQTQKYTWKIIEILESNNISFELDITETNLQKQITKAYKSNAMLCLIIGENELINNTITLKDLKNKKHKQKIIPMIKLIDEINMLIVNNV